MINEKLVICTELPENEKEIIRQFKDLFPRLINSLEKILEGKINDEDINSILLEAENYSNTAQEILLNNYPVNPSANGNQNFFRLEDSSQIATSFWEEIDLMRIHKGRNEEYEARIKSAITELNNRYNEIFSPDFK